MNVRGWFWDQFVKPKEGSSAGATFRRVEYFARWDPTPIVSNTATEKVITVEGDHLTIDAVLGALPVYVRVGDDGNPFIRVRERLVITRPFSRLTFKIGGSLTAANLGAVSAVKVTAFASWGPLMQFPPKAYGIRRLPVMRYGLTADTTSRLIDEFVNGFGVFGPTMTVGKGGGSIVITNTDLANDLYLIPALGSFTAPATGSNGYGPIRPGQTLAMALEDIPGNINLDGSGGFDFGGLVIKTLAGTCQFALILSSSELDDADGDTTPEHYPSMR